MTISSGVNGFGRFGLHLLKYWLEHSERANFSIDYINDENLGLQKILDILHKDPYVQIPKFFDITVDGNRLTFQSKSGRRHSILFTNQSSDSLSWVGEPDLFLECSGHNTVAERARRFCVDRTRKVLISATSWDCDQTIVYGFNHKDLRPESKTISYGSCTVNAFVPLASYLHKTYGVANSDVTVIHNLPAYQLKDPRTQTLTRRFCTLEKSAPNLLPFLSPDNFVVNYTLVPYTGVSIIDFRFELNQPKTAEQIMAEFEEACIHGDLQHLYSLDEEDRGPDVHKFTPYSTVLMRNKTRVLGKNLYLFGYFDNENSVNRYFDLANHVAGQLAVSGAKPELVAAV